MVGYVNEFSFIRDLGCVKTPLTPSKLVSFNTCVSPGDIYVSKLIISYQTLVTFTCERSLVGETPLLIFFLHF